MSDPAMHPRYQEMVELLRKIRADSQSGRGVLESDRELLGLLHDEIYNGWRPEGSR